MADDEIYRYLEQEFEWDRAKAVRNAMKHRVRFTEAASVFLDPRAVVIPDPDHSEDESRFVALGYSIWRMLLVVHVYRGERTRLISPRPAMLSERRQYEEQRD